MAAAPPRAVAVSRGQHGRGLSRSVAVSRGRGLLRSVPEAPRLAHDLSEARVRPDVRARPLVALGELRARDGREMAREMGALGIANRSPSPGPNPLGVGTRMTLAPAPALDLAPSLALALAPALT